jgi:phage shock protein PspC (stress-responsive transcriptional regulator)
MAEKVKRLYRSNKNRIIGGVCGGFGYYFNVDPTLIRLLWILFALAFGVGILFYFICWLIVPMNPKQRY